MKSVPCSYEFCGSRRPHWMRPDDERGSQNVDVPDDYEDKAFCSLTCAMLAGEMTARSQQGKKFHKKNECVVFIEGGILCDECDAEGHSRLCSWHWDWHTCNCGALDNKQQVTENET